MTEDSKVVGPAAKKRPPAAGKGRVKGSQNKVTRELKTMILQALDKAGGVAHLERCARDPKTAGAFLTLLGRVLPMQVTGPNGGPIEARIRDLTDEELAAELERYGIKR